MSCPFEVFPAITPLPVVHAFTRRVPGLDVKTDRETALQRLRPYHDELRIFLGLHQRHFITAEQVHGGEIARVNSATPTPVRGVDGLITDDPGVCLGIYVADCGLVFLVDPIRKAIGCIHSGKKGTAAQIAPRAIARMKIEFGSEPADIVVQLGPCIRPPHYELDFAAEIICQCRAAGILQIHDCGTCTGESAQNFYSYRRENGQTGRMLALIAVKQ